MNKTAIAFGLMVASLASGLSLTAQSFTAKSAYAEPMIVALKSAKSQFTSVDKATQGHLSIQEIDGKKYLHLDSSFSTGNGPQVEVLLHKDSVPQSYDRSNYVSLGEIKSFQGEQWYEIPSTVDVKAYQSVSIWCSDFDVTFGYAPIHS